MYHPLDIKTAAPYKDSVCLCVYLCTSTAVFCVLVGCCAACNIIALAFRLSSTKLTWSLKTHTHTQSLLRNGHNTLFIHGANHRLTLVFSTHTHTIETLKLGQCKSQQNAHAQTHTHKHLRTPDILISICCPFCLSETLHPTHYVGHINTMRLITLFTADWRSRISFNCFALWVFWTSFGRFF